MHMKSLMLGVVLTMNGGVVGVLVVPNQNQARVVSEARVDARELLAAARGVAPSVCKLAADGASNGWGGSWDAPDVAIRADVRELVRGIRRAELERGEFQALLDALGSEDNCVRHMAGTLIGRSEDRAFVAPLTAKIGSQVAYERAGAIRALGLLGDKTTVNSIARALNDASTAVRANAAWALGRIGDKTV